MGASAVKTVRRATDAFNREGLDALLEFCSPHVQFSEGDTFGEGAGGDVVLEGREQFRAYARAFLNELASFQVDLERVAELADGRVQVVAREHGRTVKGASFDLRFAWVLTLSGGLILRTTVFWKPESIRAAVQAQGTGAEAEEPAR